MWGCVGWVVGVESCSLTRSIGPTRSVHVGRSTLPRSPLTSLLVHLVPLARSCRFRLYFRGGYSTHLFYYIYRPALSHVYTLPFSVSPSLLLCFLEVSGFGFPLGVFDPWVSWFLVIFRDWGVDSDVDKYVVFFYLSWSTYNTIHGRVYTNTNAIDSGLCVCDVDWVWVCTYILTCELMRRVTNFSYHKSVPLRRSSLLNCPLGKFD